MARGFSAGVSLEESDDVYLQASSASSSLRNNVVLDVSATAPEATISKLTLTVELGPADASPVYNYVLLRDWTTNSFEIQDFSLTSTSRGTLVRVRDSTNPSRFIGPGGKIQVRISQTARPQQTPDGFTTLVDQVEIITE